MNFPIAVVVMGAVVAAGLTALLVAENARSRRRQRTIADLMNIIDSAHDGIYVTDRNRKFLHWNKTAERITGHEKQSVVGRFCYDNILCHTDKDGADLCTNECPLLHSVRSGETKGPETLYLRRFDGSRIPVEVKTAPLRDGSGSITGGVEIFQDVSEKLERERLLADRTKKLESVLNNISDGILFIDATGDVTVVNRACAGMFGLDDGLQGKNLRTLPGDHPLAGALAAVEDGYRKSVSASGLVPPDAGCDRRASLFRCWNAGPAFCRSCDVYRDVRGYLRKPRELAWQDKSYSVVSSFIEFENTADRCEIIVFHDATADKLDAALKVAGATAHELRQPMQVVLMLSTMLKKSLAEDAMLSDYTDMLAASCRRMNDVIKLLTALPGYRTKDYVGGDRILDLGTDVKNDD